MGSRNKVKNVLSLIEDHVKFREIKKDIYFADVGYGEKFLTFSLPIFDIDSFINYTSLQITKELIRRFIDIRMPKGFRTRFIIYPEENKDTYLEIYNSVEKSKILYNADLKYAGTCQNIVSLIGFSEEEIREFKKMSENSGIDVRIKNLKKKYNPDVKTILFLIDENDILTEKLDKSFFSPVFINKPINILINFVNRII